LLPESSFIVLRLSEIFLYNNDDCMYFSHVPESAFVAPGEDGNASLSLNAYYGLTRRILHVTSRFLPPTYASLLANLYTRGISNAYRLLKTSRYGLRWNDILVPRHFTHIRRISTALRLEEEFAISLDTNRKHRFIVPELFAYNVLLYTLERKWHPEDRVCLPEFFGGSPKFEMFDFTALFARRDRLWQQVTSSRVMFTCLNNIAQRIGVLSNA
jgi:hypothetical protein